jgi:hypothetical protein
MRNSDRRKTLVNFRLTGQEYAGLKAAAFTFGAPSISEYVRSIVLTSVETGLHPKVAPELDGPGLEENIIHLQATIKHLSGLLNLVGGAFVREARKQISGSNGSVSGGGS